MVSMNIGEIKFHGNFASFEENSNEIYKRYDIETTKDLIKYFTLLASKDTIDKNNEIGIIMKKEVDFSTTCPKRAKNVS